LDWSKKPEIYKNYNCSKIELPSYDKIEINKNFIEIINKRKSIRKYKPEPITLEQLSFLLYVSSGISRKTVNFEFRTVPSAGALYPIETYIHASNVDGIKQGIYHYNVKEHSLELIKEGDFKKEIAIGALSQYMLTTASAIFLWSAIFERCKWKYGERGYRYIYMESGHIAQNLALAAVSLGLDTCQIGAFFDDEINEILDLDGKNESIIYLSTVGHASI
jgi:SagB-type dehydrogenase family enzyme